MEARALIILLVLSLCHTVLADGQNIYCDSICSAECNSTCTASCSFYQTGRPELCELGVSGNVYCICETSDIWEALFPSFTMIIIAAVGSLIGFPILYFARKSLIESYQKQAIIPARQFVLQTAELPLCYSILTTLLSFFTFGIALPFLVIDSIHIYFIKFNYSGTKARFEASPQGYCFGVCCVNFFLTLLTCGLWSCCGCAGTIYRRWFDTHTIIVENTVQEGESTFYFSRARPPLWDQFVELVGTTITCGLTRPYFFVRNFKQMVKKWNVNGKKANLEADFEDYANNVCIPNCLLGFVTCGCYVCCGFAHQRQRGWIDDHLHNADTSLEYGSF